jgi:hypothetical protein
MRDDKTRYCTVGGATVVADFSGDKGAEWYCTGCHEDSYGPQSAATIRAGANAHADTCRALPGDC